MECDEFQGFDMAQLSSNSLLCKGGCRQNFKVALHQTQDVYEL